MSIDPDTEQLVLAALQVRQHAHAPYSKFAVGAALLDHQGEVHTGCNVENASYGLTVCAERVAILKAVSSGRREFTAMAIATVDGHAPCGACRQVMAEFASDLRIVLVDAEQPARLQQTTLHDLLPLRFNHR